MHIYNLHYTHMTLYVNVNPTRITSVQTFVFLVGSFAVHKVDIMPKNADLSSSLHVYKSLIHGGRNTETEHYSQIKVDLELLPHYLAQAAGKAKHCENG